MAEIYIDGEKVVFEGEPPATLGALAALLEQALASDGRVIESTVVRGIDESELHPDCAVPETGRIEVTTTTRREAAARVKAAMLDELPGLAARLDQLAGDVLRMPWADIQDRCMAVTREIGSLLEHAEALGAERGVDAAGRLAAEAAGRWVDAVRMADAANVSTAVDEALIPALRRLSAVLKEDGLERP